MASHCDKQVLLGDVENQLSPSPNQSSPNTTSATPNLVFPTHNVDDKGDTPPRIPPPIQQQQQLETNTNSKADDVATKVGQFIGLIIICVILLIVFPFVLAYVIVSVCLIGSIKWPDECFTCKKKGSNSSSDGKPKSIFSKMQEFETTKEKILRLNFVVTTRLGCLALSWLVVNLCVPSLASLTLIGYPLWKWSLLIVIVLLGYPFAALTVVLFIFIVGLYNDEFTKKPNLEYYTKGLEASLTGLLHFALILLMWLLYFRTDRGLNPSTKLDKLGTWTFVSLLVAALLWVLKSAALLEWKAKAVYKRFKGRILTAGFQLYFLQVVTRQSFFPELLPWRAHEDQDSLKSSSDGKNVEATINNNNNNNNDKVVTDDKKSLHISISNLSEKVTTDQLNYVAEMITRLAQVTQREDDGIPEVVAQYEEKFSSNFVSTGLKKENIEKYFGLNENEVYPLLKELGAEKLSEEITCDAFQKWMVDAHKNCLSVGYTLIDAFAMVSILNKVIIRFLAVMVILMWLLVTELATTKGLVLVASPILALSFVFGDTCKTFFQGVIFAFVTHPYDVGDRCIIDGMELEVKRISILTTTFLRIGTKEKMLYPHSSLATKLITNLEGEPDPNDMIELMLDSSTTMSKILDLKQDLESFFESNDRHGFYEKAMHVTLKEIGNNIKVRISFAHVMNVQDVSHSQCLQKKNKQRSELLIKIKQFLEKQEIKLAGM